MAIQNFVAGGFYGKLGQMVGQRWKNKRTLRVYTIPKNPRTPAQQAHRSQFREATQNAVIANQMNYKAPCWKSEDNTDWGLRMKASYALLQKNVGVLDKIPIYPLDWVSNYQVSTITFDGYISSNTVKFLVTGDLPTENRLISVLVGYLNEETQAYDIELYSAMLYMTAEPYFLLAGENISRINSSSLFLIASRDDENFDGSTVYCPQTSPKFEVVQWSTEIESIARENNVFTITFAQAATTASASNVEISVHGVSAGEWVDRVFSVNISAAGGKLVGSFTQDSITQNSQILAFPSGAYIAVSGNVTIDGTSCSPSDTSAQAFSNEDLSREFDSSVLAVTFTDSDFTVAFSDVIKASGESYVIGSVRNSNIRQSPTRSNVSGTLGMVGENIAVTFERREAGTLSADFLSSLSKITLTNEFSTNGVSYVPTVQTAQSIANADDKLRITIPAPSTGVVVNTRQAVLQTSCVCGSEYGSVATVAAIIGAAFERYGEWVSYGENLTTGEDGGESTLWARAYPNSATGRLAVLCELDPSDDSAFSTGDSAILHIFGETTGEAVYEQTTNFVPVVIDLSAWSANEYQSAQFNVQIGATFALSAV